MFLTSDVVSRGRDWKGVLSSPQNIKSYIYDIMNNDMKMAGKLLK